MAELVGPRPEDGEYEWLSAAEAALLERHAGGAPSPLRPLVLALLAPIVGRPLGALRCRWFCVCAARRSWFASVSCNTLANNFVSILAGSHNTPPAAKYRKPDLILPSLVYSCRSHPQGQSRVLQKALSLALTRLSGHRGLQQRAVYARKRHRVPEKLSH